MNEPHFISFYADSFNKIPLPVSSRFSAVSCQHMKRGRDFVISDGMKELRHCATRTLLSLSQFEMGVDVEVDAASEIKRLLYHMHTVWPCYTVLCININERVAVRRYHFDATLTPNEVVALEQMDGVREVGAKVALCGREITHLLDYFQTGDAWSVDGVTKEQLISIDVHPILVDDVYLCARACPCCRTFVIYDH